MNRQDRRKTERLGEWVKSLPTDKLRVIEKLAMDMSKMDIMAYSYAYERVLRVKFYEMLGNEIEAESLVKETIEGVEAEGHKIQELLKEGAIYNMEIKNNKDEIIAKYEEMKEKETKENIILKDISFIFSKLTKTAIKNIIVEHNRDKKISEDEELNKMLDSMSREEPKEQVKEQVEQASKQVTKTTKEVTKIDKQFVFKIEPSVFNAIGIHATYKVDKDNKVISVGEKEYRSNNDAKNEYVYMKAELDTEYNKSLEKLKEMSYEMLAAIKQYLN